jgi:Domain of unknown function (DUF4331)
MSPFRRIVRLFSIAMTPVILAASLVVALGPAGVGASSHREAPLISGDPTVDNTDVYAFRSPDDPSKVTLISDWIPFEEPGGGPNFYHFDPNAQYTIKVDRDGDGAEDVTYTWTFSPIKIRDGSTFLYNTNQVTTPGDTDLNITQYYTVTEKVGVAAPTTLFGNVLMVPDNVGPRSTPNYAALAAQFVRTSGTGANQIKEFTGQRDDPFYVDVGSIFDLGGLRPFNPLHIVQLPGAPGIDTLAGYNTHITAIQVPITRLAPTCTNAQADKKCVIGVWSTAERHTTTTRVAGSETGTGPFVQVSRLGNPLVNEAVIPLALKDAFNGLHPADDFGLFTSPTPAGQLFRTSVQTPTLAELIPVLYPAVSQKVATPRPDLIIVFLKGVPGVTEQQNSAAHPSEQLRLNVAIAPTAAVCAGKPMGVLDGDVAGFPNGRRLEDDVTDIAIRAVAGGYGTFLHDNFNLPNFSPNNTLADGVNANDTACLSSFPYVGTPHDGYFRKHAALTQMILPVVVNNASTAARRN